MPLTIFCIALGAALYRWRGGPTWLPAPRWLKLALCASLLAAGAFWHAAGSVEPLDAGIALAGFLAALWGLSRGHGEFMDLAHRYGAGREEEDWRWLPRLLPIRDRYWYEFAALAVTGLAATLGPGLALVLLGDWIAGLNLALAGFLKAPAYAIGWRLAKGSRATVIGEWLTGAAMGLGVGVSVG